ncbi:exosortase [Allohahella marinimesophila]|uniref:Methanolan biosynthesis EpsI domain-containing protein n=1 Tax=Allohahella marinimesophila TaxID=1054972 RepID=A0ABP7Q8F2_9GAMM
MSSHDPAPDTESAHVVDSTPLQDRTLPAQAWPVAIWLALCGIVFAPTWLSLFGKWVELDQSYGHGFLVLALTLWLIIRALPVGPGRGLAALPLMTPALAFATAGAAALWTLAWLTGVEFVQQLLVPAIIYGGLVLILGAGALYRMSVPVGILYFAMPVWDYLNYPLQWLTTKASEFALWAINIEADIYGFFVKIPQGTFEVAGGCSGLRYLLVSLLLGILYAHLYLDKRQQIVKLILSAILVSLITNWVRVAAIIAIGYYTDMQSPLIQDHDNFGWYLYAGAMIPWFWYARRLESDPASATGAAASPDAVSTETETPVRRWLWIAVAAVILCIPAGTQLMHGMTAKANEFAPIVMPGELSTNAGGEPWTRIAFRFPDAPRAEMKGFTQKYEGSYVALESKQQMTIDIYLYSREEHRAELIQYNNSLFDGRLWRPLDTYAAELPGFQWLELEHRGSGERSAVLYSYVIGGSFYTGGVSAKIGQLESLFLKGRSDAALLYSSAPCAEADCAAARQTLLGLMQTQLSDIESAIFKAYSDSH